MKIVNITDTRNNIKTLIDRVKYRGEIFGIGRRNSIDAILIQFPANYNENLNDVSNINANSKSFDFLKDEPDLYNLSDLKKIYA
ncbi:MAG: hypothetical protein AAB693_00240 [Patescibacteria group bacterium]